MQDLIFAPIAQSLKTSQSVKQGATTIHEDSGASTVSNLQVDNGGGSSQTRPPLDCLKW